MTKIKYLSLKKVNIRRARRIMRLLFLFLTLGIGICFSNNSYSQLTKISLNLKNKTVKQVFSEIEKKSEFIFFYQDEVLDADRKVTINTYDETIEQILKEILNVDDNTYFISDRSIYIIKKDLDNITHENIVQQQKKTISGVIIDKNGEAIIGANIIEKGTKNGTITDVNGNFSLRVENDAVLQISYIGYLTQEVNTESKTRFDIVLQEDTKGLDEVVVIGYGAQKKINLTGAIDYVGEEVFENRPMPNISRGLQGSIPNLNIDFTDGKPNRSPSYNIRGTTSIGQGGSALVLIDGVEGNPSLLNPNDIESVSVLKDASSAAIYGARGAFGVVLITTKSPQKEKFSITYSSNYTLRRQTESPDFVSDGYTWTKMFYDSYHAWYDYSAVPSVINKGMSFSLDYLDELERRSKDPTLPRVEVNPQSGEYIYYDNTKWYEELYKKNTYGHDQNLTLLGGSERAGFYLTGRFVDQPGIYKYNTDTYNVYNLRAKGYLQLTNWLNIENNSYFSNMKYHEPMGSNEIMVQRGVMYDAPPMVPMFNTDGSLTQAAASGVGSHVFGKNNLDTNYKVFNNRTSFTANLIDNFNLKGDFTFQNSYSDTRRLRLAVPYSKYEGKTDYIASTTNDIQNVNSNTQYISTNLYGEYENTFNAHYLKVMIGGNYELSTTNSSTVFRNGLIHENAENINLALGQSYSINQGYNQWNIVGGFYRFNYSFKDRYLFELNGRYDGSSKFPSNERFGFFPSFSAGWRLSEEPFWKIPDQFISDMKLRYSYGSLGNGNISPYAYNEKFNISNGGRILNQGTRVQYTQSPTILPAGLTWETSTTQNIGVDLSLIDSHLSFTGDIYSRKTTDMFTKGVTLPAVFGASPPYGNYADLETKGWEFSLGWRDQFTLSSKPFSYDVRFFMSDSKAKILKYNNPDKRLTDHYPGKVMGEIWGFETGGFFESEEEIKNWAKQTSYKSSVSGQSLPGDIKLMDLNNDGVIDVGANTVDNPGDRKIIGNDQPRYRYGVNLNFEWNNFYLSSFFQGIGKQDWYPDNNSATFWGMYVAQYAQIPSFHLGKIWSEDNTDAYFPRLRAYIALSHILRQPQTKYLQNASYVRLKNFQFGYNLPKTISSKVSAERINIYFSGENLWTYSPLYKLIGSHVDIENIRASDITWGSGSGGGFNYPMLKSFTLGLDITF